MFVHFGKNLHVGLPDGLVCGAGGRGGNIGALGTGITETTRQVALEMAVGVTNSRITLST